MDGAYVVQAILGDRIQWELWCDVEVKAIAMAKRAMHDTSEDLTRVRVLTRDGECVYEADHGR